MRENIGSLADFPAILAGLGITSYVVQGLNDYTTFSTDQTLLGAEDLSEHLRRLRAACKEWGVQLQLTTSERTAAEEHDVGTTLARYYPPGDGGVGQTRQCTVPWELLYIDKDGRVFPCCIAGASGRSSMGRLGDPRHGTLSEIWVGDAFQDFRTALLDAATTPEVCRQCTIVPFGPHPYRTHAAELVGPNRVTTHDGMVSVRFRNTGTEPWTPGSVLVGTTSPRDRRSALAHPTWPSGGRPCSFVQPIVVPGEAADFVFRIGVPRRQATEEFQLVAEGIAWLPNTRFTVMTPSTTRHPTRMLRRLAGHSGRSLRWLHGALAGSAHSDVMRGPADDPRDEPRAECGSEVAPGSEG
jgi:radical SAM protein with 4Fe4S-binding SPASM domain